jgi:hypothetical protein
MGESVSMQPRTSMTTRASPFSGTERHVALFAGIFDSEPATSLHVQIVPTYDMISLAQLSASAQPSIYMAFV